MNRKIKSLMQLFAFVLAMPLVSAQPDSSGFSLEEAQQYAIENSYVLQNSRHDVTIAQKEVWQAISTGLPQVSGTANYNMFLSLPVSLIPGEFFGEDPGTYIPVKFGQDYNSDFGFTVNQQIFDGTYIVAVGSAQIYLDLARHANEKSEIDIRDAVAQSYYAVLIGEQNLEVMQENLDNVMQLYNETKAYYENGFREEMDVDQMQLMVQNAENEIIKAEREIKIARTVLKYTMGYEIGSPILLSEELEDFVNPLIARHTAPGFDFAGHIDYRLATTNMQVSEKMLRLEKAAFLPRLNSFYSYTKTAYGNKANLFQSDVSWFPSSLIGFQITMPIFSSGNKVVKVQQAKLELTKAQNQRRLAESTLKKDYLTAVAEMETALEKYENDSESLSLSEKILNKSKIKFQNGLISSTELAQLETQYIQTYGAYVGSTMQLLQAHQKLKKAAGEL
ncbi:MAG: TolC family protein [Prolixibacteraceae bacterium]